MHHDSNPCFNVGLFYYTLGNLRPELRSTHRSIQLIACITSPNLKTYGFKAVLKPFIEDMNELNKVGEIILQKYLSCALVISPEWYDYYN